MNQKLFDFFADKETFDKSLLLTEELAKFNEQIILAFWEKLSEYLIKSEKLSGWVVEADNNFLLKNSKIWILYPNKDEDTEEEFTISFYINNSLTEISYGILINRNKLDTNTRVLIFHDAKKFKADGWRLGNEKFDWAIIWYPIKGIKFSEPSTCRSLLPKTVDVTVKEIGDKIIADFTKDVQDFIIKYSKI